MKFETAKSLNQSPKEKELLEEKRRERITKPNYLVLKRGKIMSSNFYRVGLNHVGAYQVSGVPYLSSSAIPATQDESFRFQFGSVTKKLYSNSSVAENSGTVTITATTSVIWSDTTVMSVDIQNPGGTGSPILPISARLAPFPPKKFFGFFIFFESLDLKFKINLFIISF